ncbi:DNA replication/repair protein RecF [Demequina sp.]|uniref:DNA replication/repair protein RecF n=1 Tax=Demequina sp. TaxID=2050685 RepID=UPI003D0F219B
MHVAHLQLADFRSYPELDLALDAGVTTFVGRNGQGKTNLVEAVRYLSTLSSHRVASDAPLIKAGKERAVVGAKVVKGGRSLTLEVTIQPGKAKTARLGRAAARPRDLVGILRTVVFAPEDLALVKGDPSTRRAFMDELCVALAPVHSGVIADYERVLRQRTSLLKTARNARVDLTTLDIWDEKLAELGGKIVAARLASLAALRPYAETAYQDVAPGSAPFSLTYSSALDTSSAEASALGAQILATIGDRRQQEIERGVCLVGPHRDDVEIAIGDLPAKGYASHGESWSCALALRLASYDLLTADGGPDSEADGEPVLILDDVFAELDSGRRAALAARIATASQVLITAAVAEDVPPALEGSVFEVSSGTVTRRD